MRIRGVPIPAIISHFFCFLFGTLIVLPWESACEMDLEGILLSPSSSMARRLANYDERAALYLLIKEDQQSCRVSDLPFYIWRDPAGKGLYVHLEKSAGAVKIIERIISSRSYEISERGAHFPNCDRASQVVYGS